MSRDRHFLFMVLEEHPYGREMLRRLLEAGFSPDLIIEERSWIGEQERRKFHQRLGDNPVAPSIAAQARAHHIAIETVPAHVDRYCMGPIRKIDPDLIVLGGTRIIRGEILTHPKDGVLNSHPGLLPECRGSASPAWSVYHDIPIGSSCHFCTPEIDAGDLVGRRPIAVHRGDRYEDLCYRTLVEAGALMAEALVAWRDDRLADLRRPQGESPHETFKNMPEELLVVVRTKLRDETYAHYVD